MYQLEDKLYEVLTDPDRLTKMSSRNLNTAQNFSSPILCAKKKQFYAEVASIVSGSANNKNNN